MKNYNSKFFYVFIYLLGIAKVFAGPEPPAPTAKKPPPPPGLDVDNGIVFLFLLAIIFGVYIIYKFQSKQKATLI